MSDLLELTKDQIRSIRDKGFCYVQTSPMQFVKITEKDIVIKKEELDKLIQNMKDNGEWDHENARPKISEVHNG